MDDWLLIYIVENWDNFTWWQRKRIWWIVMRCYWQSRLNELWQRICISFLDL